MPNSSIAAPAPAPARLAEPRPMRRGSIGERYMKCCRPGCGCATDPDARHGPYRSLTCAVDGKTKSRYLSPEQAVIARQQIDSGRQFQREVDDYWEVCVRLADQELDGSGTSAAPTGAAEKRGSKRASGKRSRRKSAD